MSWKSGISAPQFSALFTTQKKVEMWCEATLYAQVWFQSFVLFCFVLLQSRVSCTHASRRWRTWISRNIISIAVGTSTLSLLFFVTCYWVSRRIFIVNWNIITLYHVEIKEMLACDNGQNLNYFSRLPVLPHISVALKVYIHFILSSYFSHLIFWLSTHFILLNPSYTRAQLGHRVWLYLSHTLWEPLT